MSHSARTSGSTSGCTQRCERLLRQQPRQRPDRRAAHQRRRVVQQPLRLDGQRRVAGVADGVEHVAHEAVAADALDRALARTARGRPASSSAREVGQGRRASARRGRPASLSRAVPGELVPRTDRQAVVAAVDAVAEGRRGIRAGSGPSARWSGRRCSAAHRAGRARGRRWSGRRRDRRGRSRKWSARRRPGSSSSVVRIEPRNSQEPNSRLTRLVCLPCQPRPARSASGFSSSGAVSTNTFSSPPNAVATIQRARALQAAT